MKLKSDNLRVVLFDWDGTLAESSPPRVVAVNQVLKEYGLPDWNNIKHKRNSRISFMDNFPNMFGIYADEAYQKYCKIYLDIIKNGINGYPKAKELLELLRKRGIKIGIMTNKDRKLLEFELPLLYPFEYFDKIVKKY